MDRSSSDSASDSLWPRLEALLDEALELPPEERPGMLERVGRSDPALRARLERLLAADSAAGNFLSDGARAWLTAARAEPSAIPDHELLRAGDRVGAYRVIGELARGGMGIVYRGERADGQFEQRVALKLVRWDRHREDMAARFRRERQILAQLDHPSIARLVDGGVHTDGRPYFAMELVDGEPITTYCDRRRLTIESRIRLLRRVCDAVQYAHERLIVHRDLKPSNIFVTPAGDLKLLDFGIAKLLGDRDDVPAGEATQMGLRLLTPGYAAPEQLRGEPVSTATDVYALGVILFELLTGRRPFGSPGSSAAELERAVLETDPPRPSACVAGADERHEALADARGLSPGALGARLAGDLDAIVLKTLRKEPPARYARAVALADDLDRYLEGRPVAARPDNRRYRTAKFVRRHRARLAAAALLALSLGGGLAATLWQARATALEARKAQEVKAFLISTFRLADPAQAAGRDVSLRQVVDRAAERVERELASQPAVQGELLTVLAGVYAELGVDDRATALTDRALAIHERLYGSDSELVGANVRQKASLAVARGDGDAAVTLAERALAIHRRASGNAHQDVAEDLDVLAMASRQRGRLAEALAAAEESLRIRQAIHGAEHRLVAESMNNLAVLLREQGRYDEAADLYRRVVDQRRRLLGDEHPHVALTLHNLAALQHFRGEYQEASVLSRNALDRFRQLYGEDHQLTLAARSTGAAVDRFLGRYDEAEAGFRAVLDSWGRTQGTDHPNALVTLGGLARVYRERGDLAEAERLLRDLDARWHAGMGDTHPVGAAIRRQLGGVLGERGRLAEAEPLLREALERCRAAYGAKHPEVAESLHELGLLARSQGDYVQAGTWLAEALAMRRELLGERHVVTAQSLASLGTVQLAANDGVRAVAMLTEADEIMRRALPASHPLVDSVARDLARAGPLAVSR